uniref:Endoribonuclease n=2 Tax=Parascaris TaxID=6254 RepID=A0A915A9F6_PARUN
MITLLLVPAFILVSRVYAAVNGITAKDVSSVLTSLVTLDSNAAGEGDMIVKYQNMASGKYFDHDNAENPLFASVSNRINDGPTFIALRELQELYQTPDIYKEDVSSFTRRAVSHAFIDAIFYTAVMQKAWLFLGQAGLVSLDAQTFKNQLYEIWFEEYARDSVKGTSGFETIFVGEVNGTKVVGLNNWYRFYRLEMNNKTNYHGWFNRAKDVHITLQYEWGPFEAFKDAFLMGCSPEFEIAAYTICALSQFKECLFNHTTYQFSMNIETISPPGEMMKITSLAVAQYTGATTTKVTVSQKTTTKGAGDARLQKLVDDMRAADIDRPTHYVLNWGKPVSSNADVSPDALFTFVNETLFERPVYKALVDLYGSGYFIADVCQEETPLTADIVHASLLNITFDSFTNTTVFQLALEYLQEIHYVTDWPTFREKLWTYWFATYTRCKGPLGSSGFEHVFVGEWKGTEISGQHGWVKFYLLEQAGLINYYGYISYNEQLTGTIRYTWEQYLKPTGGFNVGTSPAFDFALFSVCALTRTGSNGCRFTLDGFPMGVTSYLQSCANNIDICIATAYSTN